MFVILSRFRVGIKLTMASRLQSAPENWLLGKPQPERSTARLPRGLDALRVVQFYHAQQRNTLPESYTVACEIVNAMWSRGRKLTKRIDSCARKLSNSMNDTWD